MREALVSDDGHHEGAYVEHGCMDTTRFTQEKESLKVMGTGPDQAFRILEMGGNLWALFSSQFQDRQQKEKKGIHPKETGSRTMMVLAIRPIGMSRSTRCYSVSLQHTLLIAGMCSYSVSCGMSCLHVYHHGCLVEPSFVAPCQLRHSIGVLLYQVTLQLSTSASSLRPFYFILFGTSF